MRARLAARRGHYMNPKLLDSQFAILEPPQDALRLDVAGSPERLVRTHPGGAGGLTPEA